MGEGRILIRLFGILLFLTSRLKFMQEYAFNKAHSSMRDTSQFYIRISVHLCITLFLPLVAEVLKMESPVALAKSPVALAESPVPLAKAPETMVRH